MNADKQIQSALVALVMDQPFFGALALRLKMTPDPSCDTAWTDGVSLGYNPSYIESLSHAERVGLVAHEVMHCAAGHPWRRDGRDPKRWNIGCDLAINHEVTAAGMSLPAGGLMPDPEQTGKSAEWITARLPQPDPDGDGEGEGGGTGPAGEVRDAPAETSEDEAGTTEADWRQAVQEAARAAEARGQLPGCLERFAEAQAKPPADWRSALRRFVQEAARSDYTWTRPNRRYAPLGIYLPALEAAGMGPLVVAIDTSGSVDDVLLSQYEVELAAIVDEADPARVTVIYADSRVQAVDTFERGHMVDLKAKGGGGTDFRPAFDHVAALDDAPAALIYFTDLYGDFPAEAPAYPVLWAVSGRARPVPFGETLEVAS